MSQLDTDTICAIATTPGRSGIGIVRISGPGCLSIAQSLLGFEPLARHAHFCSFRNSTGQVVDNGVALYFRGPHSFTGEDILELQGHGGPVVLGSLLRCVTGFGARLARPGEFSERAFLNGKLDLVQLEAIADLIDAGTEQAARSAVATLEGVFSRAIESLVSRITALRVYIEAAIDFSDEDIDFLAEGSVLVTLETLLADLDEFLGKARQGALLRHGMRVVIAGEPNAGKSSLLNGLSGRDTAIVTDIPGTTRDVLTEAINLDGLPLHVLDTAGLRDTSDAVEQEGVRRARQAIDSADQVLLIVDGSAYPMDADSVKNHLARLRIPDTLLSSARLSVVFNKIDLLLLSEPGEHAVVCDGKPVTVIHVSAKTGAGLDELRRHLKHCAGYRDGDAGQFIARERHIDALTRCRQSLANALHQLQEQAGPELVAEDLRIAQGCLGEITGKVSSDDLLGKIFSSFCIGK
ncbi:MAG: hypothetical protein RLZZ385_755 [Pseudomonadota bacterium]|jgi:tRNA modification GTPase